MEHYTDPIAARRPKRNLARENKLLPPGSGQLDQQAGIQSCREDDLALASEPQAGPKMKKVRALIDSGLKSTAPLKNKNKVATPAEKATPRKGKKKENNGNSTGGKNEAATKKKQGQRGSQQAEEDGAKCEPGSSGLGAKRKGNQVDELKPGPNKKSKQVSSKAGSPAKAGEELLSNGLDEAGKQKSAATGALMRGTKRKDSVAKPPAATSVQATGLPAGQEGAPAACDMGMPSGSAGASEPAQGAGARVDSGAAPAGFNVPAGFLDTIFEAELKQQRDETQLKAELVATKLRVASDVDRIERLLWGVLADLRNIKSICGIRS